MATKRKLTDEELEAEFEEALADVTSQGMTAVRCMSDFGTAVLFLALMIASLAFLVGGGILMVFSIYAFVKIKTMEVGMLVMYAFGILAGGLMMAIGSSLQSFAID